MNLPPRLSVKSWHLKWKNIKVPVGFSALCDHSIKTDKCALTTHQEHLAVLRSCVLLCLSWLENNLAMLSVFPNLPENEEEELSNSVGS